MTDVQETPEIPILLVFEDGTFVAVQPSLLIKESTVFKAQLNSPWQKRKPDDLEEQRIIGDIVKQKGRYICNSHLFLDFSFIIKSLNSTDSN